jgi:putative FmdB family regulatory protein
VSAVTRGPRPVRAPHYDRRVPIYEFECDSCGARFEDLVAAGTELAPCRECGAEGARRRLSTFGTSRQLTASQRRRLEDKRGTNRDGARQRFKQSLGRARERAKRPPGA